MALKEKAAKSAENEDTPPLAPELPKPIVTKGGFSFDFRMDLKVPEAAPKTPLPHSLPFRAWFDAAAPYVTDTVSPSFFTPAEFWTKERELAKEKATKSYQRAKIREQFNFWRKADPTGARNKYELTTIYRPGDTKENPVEGVETWLILEKK